MLNGIREIQLKEVDSELLKYLINDTKQYSQSENQLTVSQNKHFIEWYSNIYFNWAFLAVSFDYKEVDGVPQLLFDLT